MRSSPRQQRLLVEAAHRVHATLTVMIILGCVLTACAATLLVIGVLSRLKKLPGNNYVGIRLPEVRASRQNWDTAHYFAAPIWIAAAITLLIAAVPTFRPPSLLWIITGVGIVVSLYLVGLGASIGARVAGILDDKNSGTSGSGDGCCSDPAAEAPPVVDVEALRRAAGQADGTD